MLSQAAKEAELHAIIKERLDVNAGLREASANLMVGNDNERLQTLRRLAVEDATAFDTKQAD